jgi:hypothetical protein
MTARSILSEIGVTSISGSLFAQTLNPITPDRRNIAG